MPFREVKQEVNGQIITMQADMSLKAVRIHHPTLRNCLFTVELPDIIYQVPAECRPCGTHHVFKTYHFRLNEHGDTTVSAALYERFKNLGLVAEMKATKEVVPRPVALGAITIAQPGTVIPTNAPPPVRNDVVSREHGTRR